MARPLFNKALAVGLLAAVSGIAFLIAFSFFRKGGYSERDSYRVFAYYEDATGITWKSRVQIAGIQVGEVEQIDLQGNRAKLFLRIKKDIDVRADACVVKRFPSTLLPDALLDLVPGTVRTPSLRELPEDQREIRCVQEGTSVQKLLDSLNKVTTDVQTVTRELANMVSGSQGSIKQIIANVERISAKLSDSVDENAGKLSAILDNAQAFTGTLAGVAEQDRERYHEIARNVASASERLDKVLGSVQQLLGEKDGGVAKSVEDARNSLAKLSSSMEKIEKVADNVAQGKGVAGKLLADERLGEKLGSTIESVSDYVDRLSKLKIRVELRSEFLLNQSGAKTYAGFALVPRPDRYYLFQVVNDPRGVQKQQIAQVTTQTPTGTANTTTTTTTTDMNSVAFSLEFAKRFGPATFRIGIIESSGGVGADLHLLNDSLKLSLDFYQFSRPPSGGGMPRAKFSIDYTFFKYLYATAGTDDFLNSWRAGRYPGGPKFSFGNDVFIGAGIVFTDDDLKTLFGAAGSSVAGSAR